MHSQGSGFKAFIFAVLGGASTLPIVREFIKSVFWDQVVHVMNPVIAPILLFARDYGFAVAFGLAALYFGIGRDKLPALIDWSKRKLNWYLLVAAVCGCACIAALVGYFWDRSRGPIIFSWNENEPVIIGNQGDTLGIMAFAFTGANRWSAPITNIKTYVRSNKTAAVTPLLFGTNGSPESAEKIVIPGGSYFNLISVKTLVNPGMKVEDFLAETGSFQFSFEYDGGKFERDFDEAEVRAVIERWRQTLKKNLEADHKLLGPKPGVVVVK